MSATNTIYMIPKNARHPTEAWAFLRFLLSPEGGLIQADAIYEHARQKGQSHNYTGFRANRRTLEALSAKYAPRQPPFREAFEECKQILASLVPVPASPVSGVLRDEMLRAKDRASYGEMTAKEALKDADRRVQEQLDLLLSRETFPLFHWGPVWATLAALLAGVVGILVYRTRTERARSALQRYENRMAS